ncbi:citrate:proton symporter [Algoriphagus sp. D3-2-R+10]|uniref:CitMHS family transporter n=1 Tax=Algoriphagus aurantiacus TaxID=3103948 RepID=UPI002B3787B0|nr:citrate:proton symporter [Algoriphagus sp. D3-2-R+10]MEB2775337.1 citrate:proton symporter [Algoriphagus sp. D3-2-R+10]
MLSLLGFLTIVILLFLVMTKKASPVVALILVPVVMGLIGGFGFELVDFITQGIQTIAPTGVMFIFAILFFGVLTDAGTFRPIIKKLLGFAGNDPAKISVAAALLAMIVHLDGSGAVTFLVTIPAFLPLYDALQMKRSNLACIVALSAGTMNILPWGGPTIRAASALEVSVTELFNPLLIPVLVGLVAVLMISYYLGSSEKTTVKSFDLVREESIASKLERPKLFWFNIILILLAVGILVSGLAPPHVIFMIAFCIAITINYPKVKEQGERIDAHAKAAILMASILFAAGCFTGILKGSGMIAAMADSAVAYTPDWIGSHLAVITGVLAMPASLLFDPDSFYFGILPLLSSTAVEFGGSGIEVGRAAIMGQMTTGFPVSPLTGATYLLIGLTGVDLADHQRKTIPYAFLVSMIILSVSLLVGAISF